MLQWDDVRVFLAVHRSGSHARAARLLGVDPTTVARRLAALEATLETTLFERTPTGLAPRPAGRLLAARAERVETEILSSERELRGRDARLEGTVVVTAGDAIATYLLAGWLVDFRRAHPSVAIDLRADNAPLDIARGEADLAVRLFRPREKSLLATRAGSFAFGLYAAEAYLARRGRPRSARDLGGHDWIGWDARLAAAPQSRWLARTVPGARIGLRANTTTALVAACAAGHGLAVLPSFVAAVEPRLAPVRLRSEPPSREVWLATHADSRTSARIRALVTFLAARFRDHGR